MERAKERVADHLARRASGHPEGRAKALSVVRALGNTYRINVERLKISRLVDRHRAFALEAADRLRALMVQNDPDAVRSGLREIADALDQLGGREAPILDEAAD